MPYESISDEELARKVDSRRQFLLRVVRWIEKAVPKRGRLLKREVGSSNTNSVYLLRDFGDFSLLYNTGQTMMGGNSVKVWYHPDSCEVDIEKTNPTLALYYQTDPNDCEVSFYDAKTSWEDLLTHVMEHENEIAAKATAQVKALKQKHVAEWQKQLKRRELEKFAERLKI